MYLEGYRRFTFVGHGRSTGDMRRNAVQKYMEMPGKFVVFDFGIRYAFVLKKKSKPK